MSRVCQVTDKKPLSGHTVSHSNRKVKRRFLPNVRWHRFWSPNKKKFVRLKVSSQGLRIIDKLGIDQVIAKLEIKGQKF
ncbi:MAG: 50S ribosomal protein L28 [Gammaproteobacteria bacterium]